MSTVLRSKAECEALASAQRDRRLITDQTERLRVEESSTQQRNASRAMSESDRRFWSELRSRAGK